MIHSVVGGATLNTCNTTAGCSLVSACWTYTPQHHSETNSATPGEDGGVWFQAKNVWTASWCWILPVSGHCTDTSLCYVWLPVLLFFFLLCGRTRHSSSGSPIVSIYCQPLTPTLWTALYLLHDIISNHHDQVYVVVCKPWHLCSNGV